MNFRLRGTEERKVIKASAAQQGWVCRSAGGSTKQGDSNPEDLTKDGCRSVLAPRRSYFPKQTLEDGQKSTFQGQETA